MTPPRNILLLPLLLLLSVVTPPGALALKCWQGPLMNRLDVTKQVRAQECAADGTQVSCAADSYTVGGMWYMEMKGCSTEDLDQCSTEKWGQNDFFKCNCKTDFCNGAGRTAGGTATAILAAAALAAAAWRGPRLL